MNDWFERWFGAEYLALYPHRDEDEARAAVALVRRTLRRDSTGRILDLACGSGRHARAFAELGWTVGVDLSMTLLEVARRESPADPYVRGDMRALPFADRSFGLIVNLFTSFGYFETDGQNEEVIAEISRLTDIGGTFVLDYLNVPHVQETLVPEDQTLVGDTRVHMRRSISADHRYVEKWITVDGHDAPYLERVRLFSAADLAAMLVRNGLVVTHTFGDYDGSPLTRASSRVIHFAERV